MTWPEMASTQIGLYAVDSALVPSIVLWQHPV